MPAEVTATKEKHRHHQHSHHTASPLQQAQPSPESDPAPAGDAATASDPAPAETAAPRPKHRSHAERAAERAAAEAEKQRLAEEETEKQRLAAEEAERKRIADEEAEKQRIADEAERKKKAGEKAAAGEKGAKEAEATAKEAKDKAKKAATDAKTAKTAAAGKKEDALAKTRSGKELEAETAITGVKTDVDDIQAKSTLAATAAGTAKTAAGTAEKEAAAATEAEAEIAGDSAAVKAKKRALASQKAAAKSAKAAEEAATAAQKTLDNANKILTAVTDPLEKRRNAKTDFRISAKEGRRLKKIKYGIVGKIMKKVRATELQPNDRIPPATVEKKSKGEKLDLAVEKGFKDGVVSSVGSVVDAGSGIAGGIENKAKGNGMMSYTNVGDKNLAGENGWGDGEMQGDGVPIFGAVVKALQCIWDAIKLIMSIKDYFKEHQAGGHSAEERSALIMDVVNQVLEIFDTANAIMGTFTTFLGTLPIVGAVLGTITNGIATVADIVHLVKAGRAKKRMKAQKAKAKETLQKKNAAGVHGFGEEEERKSRFRHRQLDKKFKVKREYGIVNTEFAGKTRTRRLDEILAQRHAPAATTPAAGTPAATTPAATTPAAGTPAATTPAAGTPATAIPTIAAPQVPALPGGASPDEDAIRALEDYDITKELTYANENRERDGIVSLVCKDIVGLVAAAGALDPSGMTSGIMAAVTAVTSMGLLIKDGAAAIRTSARNHGRFGANINKSDKNKQTRRHNLAVINFDQMKKVAEYNLDNLSDDKFTQEGFNNLGLDEFEEFKRVSEGYIMVEERLEAMGATGKMLRAQTGGEMVEAMRSGFYKDAD